MPQSAIQQRLFALQDLPYRAFQQKLMPTVPLDKIIGVRTPLLRALAKELSGTPEAEAFLATLPHEYYDENNLHGFLLAAMKDYGAAVSGVDAFLPFVDNWATCDLLSPKTFKKHLPELWVKIPSWLDSGETYTVRFGLEMLMSFYLDEAFTPEVLERAAKVRSEEYYVRMMIAWFFATALCKQYDATLPFLLEKRLDPWSHNKAIQKAVESYRISDETKAYLRTLRV